jgi:hypothetical protein
VGGDSIDVKTAGAHQLEPAEHAERTHRKRIPFEADATTGPASSDNDREIKVQSGVSTLIVAQAEPEPMMKGGEQGREGVAVSPGMAQCSTFPQVRTKETVVPPGRLQPKSLNRDVAGASMETTPDEMDPTGARPEAPMAALTGGWKQDQAEASGGRDVSESTAGVAAATALEPRFRESPGEAVSVSTGSADAQALAAEHLSLRRGALKGVPLQDSNGRAARNATHVDAPGEFINERKPTGLAAPQGMDLARLREVVAVNLPVEQQAGSTVGSAPPSRGDSMRLAANDTFAALDADRALSSVNWVHAGAHHAEAGYLDPALGWVGIRAEASGSGVRATLVPGSMEAAQTLGEHLPGLNAYLAEHHEPVATVTLASPHNGSDGAGLDSRTGAGGGSAGHHQAGRGNDAQDIVTTESHERRIAAAAAAVSGAMQINGPITGRAGTYVSVMA